MREARFALEMREARFALETSDLRFAVDTNPCMLALEIYPAVPRPITVETRFPPPLPFVKRVAVKYVPVPVAFPARAFAPVLLVFPT
jgi:hypothetical protein